MGRVGVIQELNVLYNFKNKNKTGLGQGSFGVRGCGCEPRIEQIIRKNENLRYCTI